MDKKDLLELEKEMKVYDSTYETTTVKPGSVVEMFIDSPDEMTACYFYVCKEDEINAPENSGITNCISYNGYQKYFKDAIVDDQITAGDETYSINEIYNDVDEFINRFKYDNKVDVGTVVDVTQDGHNFIYYIVNPNEKVEVQNGLFVINTNAPVYQNMQGKRAGAKVSFDVLKHDNNLVINEVYKDLNDYNKRNNINVVKEGTVASVTLAGMPFALYISNEEIEDNSIESVGINTPLYNSINGKTEGEAFTYKTRDKELMGYVNKVYDSLEEYLSLENEKKIG